MAGLNRKSYRSTGRVSLHHGPSKPKVQSTVKIAVTEKPQEGEDPVAMLLERWRDEVLIPVVEKRDAVIGELREELRLERIRSDQADRLHARVDRARERRIEELQQELEAQERHITYLRGQLADSQSVERLASAIVGATKEGKQ